MIRLPEALASPQRQIDRGHRLEEALATEGTTSRQRVVARSERERRYVATHAWLLNADGSVTLAFADGFDTTVAFGL